MYDFDYVQSLAAANPDHYWEAFAGTVDESKEGMIDDINQAHPLELIPAAEIRDQGTFDQTRGHYRLNAHCRSYYWHDFIQRWYNVGHVLKRRNSENLGYRDLGMHTQAA
jgi:hypothetical protein